MSSSDIFITSGAIKSVVKWLSQWCGFTELVMECTEVIMVNKVSDFFASLPRH